jgi:hypothetical protein
MGHDRDGQVRRPFADIFHLQPDRGLEFFAGFRWLLQVSIAIWPRKWPPPPVSVRRSCRSGKTSIETVRSGVRRGGAGIGLGTRHCQDCETAP